MSKTKPCAEPKNILVGTYRKPQLEEWVLPRGLYNFPVSETDAAIRAAAPTVSELWLYAGKADKLRFSAAFEREVTLADLVALGYPRGNGKPHAEKYLLFRVKPVPPETRQEASPRVFLRLRDFIRSAKVLARLRKQFGEQAKEAVSPHPAAHPATKEPAIDVSQLDNLPGDLLQSSRENLFVCEASLKYDLRSCFQPSAPTNERTLRAVELFAGIGGFRLACDRLGIQTVWANDIDEKAVKVYSSNFGDREIVQGDINKVKAGIPDHDILLAGFPCQPFSKAGKKRGVDDFRGTLFESIVDVLRAKNPPFFVLENVSNLLSLDKGRHFMTILSALCSLEYHLEWKVFNTANLGLPQHRERIIIVGAKTGDPETSRLLTQAEADSLKDEAAATAAAPFWWRNILEIRTILPKWGKAHSDKYIAADFTPETDVLPPKRLKDVLDANPGPEFDFTEDTLRRIAESTVVNKFYNGVQLLFNQGGGARMGYTIFGTEGLAPTLTASSSRHYERYGIGGQYRRLTNTEYAKIQGFPEQHCRAVSVYDQYKLFGNALPPVLAEWAIDRLVHGKTSRLSARTPFLLFG